MPLLVFMKLGLPNPIMTSVTLQLADCSLTYPRGIIEIVLVKVEEFISSAYFIVVDFEEDNDNLIILRRPFLANGRALIDVKKTSFP